MNKNQGSHENRLRVVSSAAKPMRKDGILKRMALIDYATEMFLELGYEKASMNNLVKLCGSSKSTLYKHFPSKEDLFIAVVDEELRGHLDAIDNLNLADLDVEEALLRIAKAGIDAITNKESVNLCRLVYAEAERIPDVGEIYYEHGPRRGIGGVEKYLSNMVSKSKIRCHDTTIAAEVFWGMLLHKPMLERYCGVKSDFTPRERNKYVNQMVSSFMSTYIEKIE